MRTICAFDGMPIEVMSRYVPPVRALLGCARLSTFLIKDLDYFEKTVLSPLSRAIETGRVLPDHQEGSYDLLLQELLFPGGNGRSQVITWPGRSIWSLIGMEDSSEGDDGSNIHEYLDPLRVLVALVPFLPRRVDALQSRHTAFSGPS